MTVVIADTSPINYLVSIGEIGLLPLLYHDIVIPEAVFLELSDISAPMEVREWATCRPNWIAIRSVSVSDAALMELDAGEAAAIALAELTTNSLLLIDETAGRQEASRRGIPNTGTLGVLRRASIEGLVDLPSALNGLVSTNFRVSKSLVADLLAEDADRRRNVT
jgi:predicted nucleic acid-binding protein